jgi:hypothetical protein
MASGERRSLPRPHISVSARLRQDGSSSNTLWTTGGAGEIPADASDEWNRLFAATALIETGGTESITGIDSILALLRAYGTNSEWSVNHYAALAAKASITIGEARRADEVLKLARALRPADPELAYLQRVASRAQTLTMSQR